ncbi:MAG: chromosomal replication initiator protein DnaA, partial [Acidobacteria bacterium]|nr:chromosomal replication initiator protein DnaA [Acidobacteriota bacterium]
MTESPPSWPAILEQLKRRLSPQSFSTWFAPVRCQGVSAGLLTLEVPNQMFKDWLVEHYGPVLEESILAAGSPALEVRIVTGEVGAAEPTTASHAPPTPPSAARTEPQQTPFELEEADFPADRAGFVDVEQVELPLQSRYTFNNFVVGSSNQFAHAAAVAVADSPSKAYNPLYIYGGVGLGKTHLMHAIGHAIRTRNRHLRLCYLSAERFMNELINSIRYEKTLAFREKYRNIDVLLMDDIQFMAGKERTQEEFFHTFNALYDGQKQIVITSDCPPREIPTLEERLHSRFEWGLIADIQPPDLETKVAILRRKAEADHVELPDSVALFIANKIKSNIRELEGALVRLVAYASLTGQQISVALAQETLRGVITEEQRNITIEMIQKAVAEYYGLRTSDLKLKNNSRSIAVPRQVAMYLCKKLTTASLPEIGREFGGKHHTTVLHSFKKMERLCSPKGDFHNLIN